MHKSINEPGREEDLFYGNVISQSHDDIQGKQELILSHCFLPQRASPLASIKSSAYELCL